jgi:hypothetical protein
MEFVNTLAACRGGVHTLGMTLKHASLLAFAGTLLLTLLLVGDFVLNLMSLARGLIAVVTVLTSLIYAFAAVTVAMFFYAFHKAQS